MRHKKNLRIDYQITANRIIGTNTKAKKSCLNASMEFMCENGDCIPLESVCDGRGDCVRLDDESYGLCNCAEDKVSVKASEGIKP